MVKFQTFETYARTKVPHLFITLKQATEDHFNPNCYPQDQTLSKEEKIRKKIEAEYGNEAKDIPESLISWITPLLFLPNGAFGPPDSVYRISSNKCSYYTKLVA